MDTLAPHLAEFVLCSHDLRDCILKHCSCELPSRRGCRWHLGQLRAVSRDLRAACDAHLAAQTDAQVHGELVLRDLQSTAESLRAWSARFLTCAQHLSVALRASRWCGGEHERYTMGLNRVLLQSPALKQLTSLSLTLPTLVAALMDRAVPPLVQLRHLSLELDIWRDQHMRHCASWKGKTKMNRALAAVVAPLTALQSLSLVMKLEFYNAFHLEALAPALPPTLTTLHVRATVAHSVGALAALGHLTALQSLELSALTWVETWFPERVQPQLPAALPSLTSLELRGNYDPRRLLPGFFQAMPGLQRLVLARSRKARARISELAQFPLPDLSPLTQLRELACDRWLLWSEEADAPLPPLPALTSLRLINCPRLGLRPAAAAGAEEEAEVVDEGAETGAELNRRFGFLAALPALRELRLAQCELRGWLPAALGALQELTLLDLRGSGFSGAAAEVAASCLPTSVKEAHLEGKPVWEDEGQEQWLQLQYRGEEHLSTYSYSEGAEEREAAWAAMRAAAWAAMRAAERAAAEEEWARQEKAVGEQESRWRLHERREAARRRQLKRMEVVRTRQLERRRGGARRQREGERAVRLFTEQSQYVAVL